MRRWLVISSLAVHFAVIFALFVAGFWQLDRLDAGKRSINLRDVPFPPPPAAAGGPTKVAEFKLKQRKHITHDLVEPAHVDPTPDKTTAEVPGTGGDGPNIGPGSGEEPGHCLDNCGPGPDTTEPPKPEPKPAPVVPTNIAPTVLLGLRISGETQIQPPDVTKTIMQREGRDRVMASFKICLDTAGTVSTVKLISTSRYAEYDLALSSAIHDWRYRPYTVNNQAIPVCGVVTFIYRMK